MPNNLHALPPRLTRLKRRSSQRRPGPAFRPTVLAHLALLAAASLAVIRCEDPVKAGASGRAFTPIASASVSEVAAFLAAGMGGGAGGNAKLIYVDLTSPSGALCFIDFSEKTATPAIHVIAAAKAPEVPVISPDGKWAVYASGTGTEAGSPENSHSSVYLVKLEETAKPLLIAADSACEPRFVQNPAGKLTVLYTTKAPNVAWEGKGRTMQAEVDVSGAVPVVDAPKVLWASGSFTGGLSWDGRYLCGGGGHVAMLDLKGEKGRADTLSYNLIQSCNASISSSRIATNTMLYLNTEGSSPAIDGGKPWGEWQTILISDGAKNLIKGFSRPAAFAHPVETATPSVSNIKWHHCEWSSHPYFATATLNVDRFFKSAVGYDNTGLQERIYLINLKDSTYLEVLRPDTVKTTGKAFDVSGLYWPWLWVEVPPGFAEDKEWLKP
ncbi:MAG: hypothetical protein JWP91_3606 [Fibrobacteres bacterium]|nr:hypothetical protein [Fibrobacterota bacterium]